MVRQAEGGSVIDGDDGNVRLFWEIDGKLALLDQEDADGVKFLCLNAFRCKDGKLFSAASHDSARKHLRI